MNIIKQCAKALVWFQISIIPLMGNVFAQDFRGAKWNDNADTVLKNETGIFKSDTMYEPNIRRVIYTGELDGRLSDIIYFFDSTNKLTGGAYSVKIPKDSTSLYMYVADLLIKKLTEKYGNKLGVYGTFSKEIKWKSPTTVITMTIFVPKDKIIVDWIGIGYKSIGTQLKDF
jgi:hypothetical protein